jgi:Domain of unknown function (DUF4160)
LSGKTYFSNLNLQEGVLTPTVFRQEGFRFYFFSREETRMHIHVHGQAGEAKFWIEPQITLAENYGLSGPELNRVRNLIRKHEDDIRNAWHRHFGG